MVEENKIDIEKAEKLKTQRNTMSQRLRDVVYDVFKNAYMKGINQKNFDNAFADTIDKLSLEGGLSKEKVIMYILSNQLENIFKEEIKKRGL